MIMWRLRVARSLSLLLSLLPLLGFLPLSFHPLLVSCLLSLPPSLILLCTSWIEGSFLCDAWNSLKLLGLCDPPASALWIAGTIGVLPPCPSVSSQACQFGLEYRTTSSPWRIYLDQFPHVRRKHLLRIHEAYRHAQNLCCFLPHKLLKP